MTNNRTSIVSDLSQSMKQGILCITFLYQQEDLLINQGDYQQFENKCRPDGGNRHQNKLVKPMLNLGMLQQHDGFAIFNTTICNHGNGFSKG